MKKMFVVILFIMFMPFVVRANQIGEFYKYFSISFDCSECKDIDTKEINLQLFANGEALDGYELILNKDNDFEGYFEDLPIFEDDGITEIEYEVKFLEDGEYKSFAKNDVTYEKNNITGWVSVLPENIEVGKEYVFLTDNWNHQYNGKDPFILVGGATFHQYIDVFAEYNLINGKKSFYMLDGEPDDRALLSIGVPSKDVDYYSDIYEDYVKLNNLELDKSLTLKAEDGHSSYKFMLSSRDGYQDDEATTYINRVKFEKIEDEISRFYITSEMVWSEDYTSKKWVGIGSMVELKAQRKAEYGAHFIAFEYVEDVEAEQVYSVVINKSLCKVAEDNRKILLSDSVEVLSVFKDIDDIEGIEFSVADPTIVKVENGKVIPLKIGETDVTFRYALTDYSLHVIVYDDPNQNPNTVTYGLVAILAIAIISGALFTIIRRKKAFLN